MCRYFAPVWDRPVAAIDNYVLEAKGAVDYEGGKLQLDGVVAGQPQLKMTIVGQKIADTE